MKQRLKINSKKITEEQLPAISIDSLVGNEFFLNSILSHALEFQATSVHLVFSGMQCRIFYRIGGKLQESLKLPTDDIYSVKRSIKDFFAFGKNDSSYLQEQTKVFFWQGQEVSLLCSLVKIVEGERLVIKINQVGAEQSLVMNTAALQDFESILEASKGVVFLGGTKNNLRQRLFSSLSASFVEKKLKICFIGDVIKLEKGIDHLAVRPEIGFGREVALRSALRADYDVVMLDVVAKREELDFAIDMAAAGKLMIIGVPVSGVNRILKYIWHLSARHSDVIEQINGFISGITLPGLCRHCQEVVSLPSEVKNSAIECLRTLTRAAQKSLSVAKAGLLQDINFFSAPGCVRCNSSGLSGELDIFEVAIANKKIERLIKQNKSDLRVRDIIDTTNFVSLRQDAIIKAANGLVDYRLALNIE